MTIDTDYLRALAPAAALAARATAVLAGGASHDSWRFAPFAPAFVRAEGPRKWGVDGRAYIDLWMGHGSLLLGHSHPAVVAAVREQLARATHLGGFHPLQVEWAERVAGLVPSAERVRFTSSGTEATLLALRVARAYTGRRRIIRVDGHFHGWHDEALASLLDPASTGLHPSAATEVHVVPPGELAAVAAALAARDVAAVILEPGGGSSGSLAFDPAYLRGLRAETCRAGTLLVFDEVISGFRYAPGGAQALAQVTPDLTALAKILCGGLPGGAVAGRADVMAVFGLGLEGGRRVTHAGTFNANPLSASAGVATLAEIADGAACGSAAAHAVQLVDEINDRAARLEVDVRAYAQHSTFHVLIGAVAGGHPIAPSAAGLLLPRAHPQAYAALRRALLIEGVDAHASHGWLSTAHADVLDDCAARYTRALVRVRAARVPGAVGAPARRPRRRAPAHHAAAAARRAERRVRAP